MWTSCGCRRKRRSEGAYPDFVAKLKSGRLLVVEYKGGHRVSNDDSLAQAKMRHLWKTTQKIRAVYRE